MKKKETTFQGDLDQYFNMDHPLMDWRPVFSKQPEPTPRTLQLEMAMEAGYPPISGDTDPRTKELR